MSKPTGSASTPLSRLTQTGQRASGSSRLRDTRPSHYQRYDPEPITVIEKWGCGFHLGNVIKYVVRAKHKGEELRDLRKALWYLSRHIEVREAELAGREAPPPEDQA